MRITRRAWLSGAAAFTGLGWRPAESRAQAPTSRDVHASFDPWIEIRPDHLHRNVREVHRRVGGRPILAVIKNNGYGLGVTVVARLLEPLEAIAGFAVVKLHEAVSLRDAGIRKPVLLMGPFDERDLEEAVARDIRPMVYTPVGTALDRLAEKRGRPVPIHICVDTGIGRVGVPYREAAPLIRDLVGRPGVRLEGLMMTFTEDEAFDREQLRRFQALTSALEREGIRLGFRHAASSFALFMHDDAFLDMVRPGMALYGVYPEQRFRTSGLLTLTPAVAFKTRVVYVKQLRKGESAGYERAFVAPEDVWVATLPVGHGDGWPRAAAKGARVRIRSERYPLVATVSASHSIALLGREAKVAIGDEAVLFDWEPGSRPEDVAAACGVSVYDLLMHLNPLLPRRLV